MATEPEKLAPAVSVALAHIEAWSNHEFDAAREALAPDVHVTVTSTMEHMPQTDTTGAEEYLAGLIPFAEAVVPGSARIDGSVGDERNALVLVTVKTAGPPMGPMTLPAASTCSTTTTRSNPSRSSSTRFPSNRRGRRHVLYGVRTPNAQNSARSSALRRGSRVRPGKGRNIESAA